MIFVLQYLYSLIKYSSVIRIFQQYDVAHELYIFLSSKGNDSYE